jgi:hypothetical protein
MQRFARQLAVAGAVVSLAAACSPEVVIARRDGTAGGAGAAASGAGGSGGSSEEPAGGEAGAVPNPEPARLLADSVADFSLTQGDHGWYYGYDGGSLDSFTLLTLHSVITAYMPASKDTWDCWATDTAHWTQIFRLGAHPNGTDTSTPSNAILQRAVRRWISTYAGNVIISGELAKIDVVTGGSNGVDGLIYVDGTQLYTAFVGGEDGGGLSYRVPATLQLGSTVDFVLDPHEGDDHHDLSRFTAIVARDDAAATP